MHRQLDGQYYCKTNTLGDGNCLWHAFVDQFSDPEIRRTVRKEVRDISPNADVFRQNVVVFARENQNDFLTDETIVEMLISDEQEAGGNRDVHTIWEEYLRKMSKPGEFATELIVKIAAIYFGKTLKSITETYVTDWHGGNEAQDPPFVIVNIGNFHFQSVRRIHKSISSASEQAPPSAKRTRFSTEQSIPSNNDEEEEDIYGTNNERTDSPSSSHEMGLKCKGCEWTDNSPKALKKLISHLRSKKGSGCREYYDFDVPESVVFACRGCKYVGPLLGSHLSRNGIKCQELYDMNAIETLSKQRKRKQHAAYNDENKEKAAEYYNRNKEEITEKMAAYYNKNKERLNLQRVVNKKKRFQNKNEEKRFIEFCRIMKNVCAYGCICCHRVLSSTNENKIKGGLDGLKRHLGEKNPMFTECILDERDLPKALRNSKEVYLCKTCDVWLTEKRKMPPMCYNNGLGVDKRPPELKDLNDLEATLIAKRILFLKIFKMPVSRWYLNKDHAIMVPNDDDTILETFDTLTFPRLPNEGGLIPVDLKRKLEYQNTHVHSYVQPKKMIKAVEVLKELNHRGYQDIKIENRYSLLSDLPESDDSDSEGEEEVLDCIERNQFDLGGSTTLMNTNQP